MSLNALLCPVTQKTSLQTVFPNKWHCCCSRQHSGDLCGLRWVLFAPSAPQSHRCLPCPLAILILPPCEQMSGRRTSCSKLVTSHGGEMTNGSRISRCWKSAISHFFVLSKCASYLQDGLGSHNTRSYVTVGNDLTYLASIHETRVLDTEWMLANWEGVCCCHDLNNFHMSLCLLRFASISRTIEGCSEPELCMISRSLCLAGAPYSEMERKRINSMTYSLWGKEKFFLLLFKKTVFARFVQRFLRCCVIFSQINSLAV